MHVLIHLLYELGALIACGKDEGPVTRVTFLGVVVVDNKSLSLNLPHLTANAFYGLLLHFASSKRASLRQM